MKSSKRKWPLLSSCICAECREITDALYGGLDVTGEIGAVLEQKLGDTVLLRGQRLDGFAVCHAGPGTEAGSGLCYVKFGALRPGLGEKHFDRLIDACDALAAGLGATRLEVGVNMACHEAYRRLCERGFRAGLIGVATDRPNESAYNRSGVFALSDWRLEPCEDKPRQAAADGATGLCVASPWRMSLGGGRVIASESKCGFEPLASDQPAALCRQHTAQRRNRIGRASEL